MTSYRIVNCKNDGNEPIEMIVPQAASPEDAALKATGQTLVRSGRQSDLQLRVYFQHAEQPLSMVRLYSKAIDRA